MKIVYCITGIYNSGGMERVLSNKVNYLVQKGYDITIITTDQLNREPFYKISSLVQYIDLGINYEENNNKGFFKKLIDYPIKQRVHKEKLNKILHVLKPDVTISMFGNDVSFLYKIKDGSKKVIEIHFSRNKYLLYGRNGLLKLADIYRNRRDLFLVKKYDKFIVLTHEDKADWGDLNNMEVIPNAFTELGGNKVELTNNKVIAIGRFDYQKGFDLLIKSWEIIYQKFPNWHLDIIGDGELRLEYENLINQYQLNSVITLKKATKNILDEYQNTSLLALTSRYEGLPLVILESMSMGIPVVAFSCKCGPKDIIDDGQDGYLVEPNDINSFANKIMSLMADSTKRKSMGDQAYIKASLFDTKSVMEKWTSLFNRITFKGL